LRAIQPPIDVYEKKIMLTKEALATRAFPERNPAGEPPAAAVETERAVGENAGCPSAEGEAAVENASDTVVLVHGLAASRLVMWPIAKHLARCGFQTINWGYPSIFGDVEQHAERLHRRLQSLEQDPAVGRIRLVTHSMGGIVARRVLLSERFSKLRNMVMLGPPNRGSRVSGIVARVLGWACKPLWQLSDAADSYVNRLALPDGVEIGVIAAQHDRVLAVENSHLPNEADHLVVSSGHTSMLFRREVALQVEAFLRNGRFRRDG
jgi:pimeloyl-ACP methyl ester carboxylesterase